MSTIYPGDGDARHGTANGYRNLHCRCDECRCAHAEDARARRNGTHVMVMHRGPTTIEWLFSRSTRTDSGCVEWGMGRNSKGYGIVRPTLGTTLAHRAAWILANGPIPDGMTIDHLCFNPPCINPSHLRILSREENSRRQRSTLRTHCNKGHEFTPENTIWPRLRSGRQCRECTRYWKRKYTRAMAIEDYELNRSGL